MAFMRRCCIILKSSNAARLQSVLVYLNVVLQWLMQLQVDAVMEHVVKIVETETFSGIHVKMFSLWDLGAVD